MSTGMLVTHDRLAIGTPLTYIFVVVLNRFSPVKVVLAKAID